MLAISCYIEGIQPVGRFSTDLVGGQEKGSLFGSGAGVAPDGLHAEAALATRWRYYEKAMTIIVTLSGAPPERTWSRS